MKAKVGLIIDDLVVSEQLYNLIEYSRRASHYEITHLILQDTEQQRGGSLFTQVRSYLARRGIKKLIENLCFRALGRFERLLLSRQSKVKTHFRRHSLRETALQIISVQPKVSKSGLVYRYREEDLAKIREAGLSILIRGGGGILRGEILKVCPQGILSFHHADNDVNRGTPPAFWEVYERQRRTGFIIQILHDELDGGDVVFRGDIATGPIYTLNLVQLYAKANRFMHQTLERLFRDEFPLKIYPKRPYAHPLYTLPSVGVQLNYLMKTYFYMMGKVIDRVRSRSRRWGVAYQFCEDWRDVTLWKSKRIPNPPSRFLADPFIYQHEGRHYCFVEDFDYREGKGRISAFSITPEGHQELGVALEEPFHLSFPFIFEHEGELYMCPETHEAREVRLYRCLELPCKWELTRVLLRDVNAADNLLFYRDHRWWLLSNLCSSDIDDHGSELHIYSTNDLLEGEWRPHPENPVIFNAERGRNGGLIHEDGRVYRVFQRQGWDLYGEAFGVAEITRLSMEGYEERALFEVEAHFMPQAIGTHTFNFAHGLMVTDFVRVEDSRK